MNHVNLNKCKSEMSNSKWCSIELVWHVILLRHIYDFHRNNFISFNFIYNKIFIRIFKLIQKNKDEFEINCTTFQYSELNYVFIELLKVTIALKIVLKTETRWKQSNQTLFSHLIILILFLHLIILTEFIMIFSNTNLWPWIFKFV